jgi:hypothetical protein
MYGVRCTMYDFLLTRMTLMEIAGLRFWIWDCGFEIWDFP